MALTTYKTLYLGEKLNIMDIMEEKIKMQRNDESLMPYEFIPIGSYRRMIIKNNKHTNAVIEKASFVF